MDDRLDSLTAQQFEGETTVSGTVVYTWQLQRQDKRRPTSGSSRHRQPPVFGFPCRSQWNVVRSSGRLAVRLNRGVGHTNPKEIRAMLRVYKLYTSVKVEGDVQYCARVEECLDSIAALPDGKKLLSAICGTPHEVTIKDSGGAGNLTSRTGEGYRPKLLQAIHTNNQLLFKNELVAAVNNSRRGGISLEHIARQLTLGLTPATYNKSRIGGRAVFTNKNVVRPDPSWYHGYQPKNVIDKTIASNAQVILDLGQGDLSVGDLPIAWKNDLPRILRNYLVPGPGLSPTVKFNPLGHMHCVEDPAMHQRPPAIGLAHELIHAMHCMKGVNMADVKSGSEKLEEIITTGFPPYNFEEFSDNKLRTQWPSHLSLRMKY